MAKTQSTTKKKTATAAQKAPQKAPAPKAPKVKTYSKADLVDLARLSAPRVVSRWLDENLD